MREIVVVGLADLQESSTTQKLNQQYLPRLPFSCNNLVGTGVSLIIIGKVLEDEPRLVKP